MASATYVGVARASVPFEPYLSLRETAQRIAAREVSPVDLTGEMLARIAAVDPILKSYATVMADSAMADAQVAAREIASGRYRGLLHGVPIGIKDLCWTRGVRTMGGLAVRRGFVPQEDATVVARLRAAGAVVLGKLNLSEGAAAGYNPAMDVPLNPWNHDRWPGLSSSGSGVAVAAGLCFGAVGTDTGGSIRMPASANGVVGLKPTYGRVSRYGVMAMADSLDHVGPLAREVADAALMFDAMAGHDPLDPASLDAAPANAAKALGGGVRGLRLGVDRDYAFKGVDPEEAKALEAALKVLQAAGARIVEVRMPDVSDVPRYWGVICSHEMAAAHAGTYPARAGEYGPYLRAFLADGAAVTPEQLGEARRRQAALTAQLNELLATIDVLVSPASDAPAWPITHALQVGPRDDYHRAWGAAQPRSAQFTMPMDLAGVPAICVPCGFSADGLPYSLQLTGRRLSEAMLCRAAFAYEQATDWRRRHPPVSA
ncbi:MAG TPA: amidase [Phenylobacterium sp.]|nr:amidase [Phenylobacterium sp.]